MHYSRKIILGFLVIGIVCASGHTLVNYSVSSYEELIECLRELKPVVLDLCDEMGYDDGKLFSSMGSYTRMICINYLYEGDPVNVEDRQQFILEYTCDPPNLTSARLYNP